MWESVKSWLIVVGVIAVLCMISFLLQGLNEYAGWCAVIAAVCAIFLADFYFIDDMKNEGEEDQ